MKKPYPTKNQSIILAAALAAISFETNVDAALVINIDSSTASLAAFQANDSNLQNDSVAVGLNNAGGFNGARGAGALTSALIATTSGTTTITAETTGGPNGNGFAANGDAHNAGDPILGSNLFANGTGQLGVDFSNLSSLDTGSTITVTVYGIGDNFGQDSSFSAAFGGTMQSGDTIYNLSTDRGDATGSVTFQQFSFIADGTTDILNVTVEAGPGTVTSGVTSTGAPGSPRSHFSGISISVTPVPEPSSAALLGLGGLALILRRRK